jgi:hypothetical protein
METGRTTGFQTLSLSQLQNMLRYMVLKKQKLANVQGGPTKRKPLKATKQFQRRNVLKLPKKLGVQSDQRGQRQKFVSNVVMSFRRLPQKLLNSVTQIVRPKIYVKDVQPAGVEDVFNITVAGCHEYYANGVLCHNCYDETRYMILDERPEYAGSVKLTFPT